VDPITGSGPEKCKRCGMVATGYARINDDRYCHGDDSDGPTCYEQASRVLASHGARLAGVHEIGCPSRPWHLTGTCCFPETDDRFWLETA